MPRATKPKNAATSAAAPPPAPAAMAHSASLRQLAHELNSLLDGSMRCVGLARRSLQDQPSTTANAIDDGLGKAQAAMRHMAALLERAMKQAAAPEPLAALLLFDESRTLAELAQELQGLLAPHAASAQASLTIDVDENCCGYAAGPLGPVMMNGIRNALQACDASENSLRTVTAAIARDEASLIIAIEGPSGPKPAGHRIGMALSDKIVRDLGGEMALTSTGDRATLCVCVPLKALQPHA